MTQQRLKATQQTKSSLSPYPLGRNRTHHVRSAWRRILKRHVFGPLPERGGQNGGTPCILPTTQQSCPVQWCILGTQKHGQTPPHVNKDKQYPKQEYVKKIPPRIEGMWAGQKVTIEQDEKTVFFFFFAGVSLALATIYHKHERRRSITPRDSLNRNPWTLKSMDSDLFPRQPQSK